MKLATINFHASGRLSAISLFVVATMAILFHTLATNAAWGDFDTSFGFQGATVDPITGYTPRSVAIQPDGKILVTGYVNTYYRASGFFLRRYLSDGQLDTAFGTNGAALGPETNSYTTDYRGDKIVVQANGRIAVSGWANGRYAVWQFTSTGIRDKTFGQNGLSLTSYPVVGNAYPEMNLQSGRLLLSLRKRDGNNDLIALVRLTASGALDVTFGNSGESQTGVSGGKGSGTVVETDGKITISGVKLNDLSARGLERKLANGQNDPTFSPPSIFSFGAIGSGLVKMVNGKYAMRWGNLGGNGSVTVTFDRFSAAGVFETSIAPYNLYATDGCPEVFTNQNDGKLLAQFAGLLFRTNSDFSGQTEVNFCSNLSGMTYVVRSAIQSDDKMVVAGIYNNYLTLVRLLPN